MMQHSGSGWIASNRYGKDMSPLGVAVADLLGDVFLGIYHLRGASLSKVQWSNHHHVEVTIDRQISTYDGDELTRLVVLAHDRMMRVSIEGIGPGYMRITFHQRKTRDGDLYERHPTLEEHTTTLRKYYGEPVV